MCHPRDSALDSTMVLFSRSFVLHCWPPFLIMTALTLSSERSQRLRLYGETRRKASRIESPLDSKYLAGTSQTLSKREGEGFVFNEVRLERGGRGMVATVGQFCRAMGRHNFSADSRVSAGGHHFGNRARVWTVDPLSKGLLRRTMGG